MVDIPGAETLTHDVGLLVLRASVGPRQSGQLPERCEVRDARWDAPGEYEKAIDAGGGMALQ
jgi:hypothetical protein